MNDLDYLDYADHSDGCVPRFGFGRSKVDEVEVAPAPLCLACGMDDCGALCGYCEAAPKAEVLSFVRDGQTIRHCVCLACLAEHQPQFAETVCTACEVAVRADGLCLLCLEVRTPAVTERCTSCDAGGTLEDGYCEACLAKADDEPEIGDGSAYEWDPIEGDGWLDQEAAE